MIDPFDSRTTPREGAAHWFSRMRSGDMNAESARAFQVWRDRDAANDAAFAALERYWDRLMRAMSDPTIMTSREQDGKRFDQPARARLAGIVAVCATLMAVSSWAVASSGILVDFGLAEGPPPQELKTSIGQRTTVTLRDGSVVTLDTDTLLRLHENNRERRLELVRGRAFFEVAKDRHRPFIVAAAGKTVRATGTAFDVRVESDQLSVTLLEGRVRVAAANKQDKESRSVDMRAGWRLVANDERNWAVAPVDLKKEMSWHVGQLAFYRDPLPKALSEVNRYTDRKIVFRGQAPNEVVVGVFKAGDVDGFVRALELNKLARVASSNDERVELIAW